MTPRPRGSWWTPISLLALVVLIITAPPRKPSNRQLFVRATRDEGDHKVVTVAVRTEEKIRDKYVQQDMNKRERQGAAAFAQSQVPESAKLVRTKDITVVEVTGYVPISDNGAFTTLTKTSIKEVEVYLLPE